VPTLALAWRLSQEAADPTRRRGGRGQPWPSSYPSEEVTAREETTVTVGDGVTQTPPLGKSATMDTGQVQTILCQDGRFNCADDADDADIK